MEKHTKEQWQIEDNTSKQYAKQLAKESITPYIESMLTPDEIGFTKSGFIDGYIKAIEETNVKGLIELRDEVLKVWNEDGENGEIQMKTPIAWLRVLRLAEALNKGK